MKKKFKLLCIYSSLIFMGTTLASPALAENIKVGVILPLTGKLAKFGEIEHKSFLMAVDEINATGGVKGNRIDLIIEDTDTTEKRRNEAVQAVLSVYILDSTVFINTEEKVREFFTLGRQLLEMPLSQA